jgi:hypothetical protein
MIPFLTFTDIPIECKTKSILPPRLPQPDQLNSKSVTDVASAGMIGSQF